MNVLCDKVCTGDMCSLGGTHRTAGGWIAWTGHIDRCKLTAEEKEKASKFDGNEMNG